MSTGPGDSAVEAALGALPQKATRSDFEALLNGLPATASAPNAILYSKALSSGVSANDVAPPIAAELGWSVLDKTPRGQFLSDPSVGAQLRQILQGEGLSREDALNKSNELLYGKRGDIDSLKESYWGQASREFAATLSGRVLFIGPNAEPGRTFGAVEMPALESNPAVASVNDIPMRNLAGNPDAFDEIKRASAKIIGSDGIVEINPDDTGSTRNYALTREGGARLGLSAIELASLPTYSSLMEIPGARPLQEPTEAVAPSRAVEVNAPDKRAAIDEQAHTLSEPQRALLENLKEVMRQRGDSERAVTMAESMAAERFQRLNAAAGKADRAPPQITVVDRTAERVTQRSNATPDVARVQERAL